mgnify:CR=1 FL=1
MVVRVISLVLLISLSACAHISSDTEDRVDQLFAEYDGNTVPGAAVLVIKEGEVLVNKGFGIADFSSNMLVGSNTNFRLASVSKQFTALAVLQLIGQGKLQLSTPLAEVLVNLPDWAEQITIRDMLRHTSGIVDYESLVPESYTKQVVDQDVFDILATETELNFSPGTEYKYSNSAYALLTLIVEQISVIRYSDYLEQNIFKPVGMTTTMAFDHDRHRVINRAFGYELADDGTLQLADQSRFSAVLGDGGIYSNLNDLSLWLAALDNQTLLSEPLNTEWMTDQKDNSGRNINYGYGWRLESYRDLSVTYHTGISRGFRNVLYRVPDKRFAVVILTNRTTDGILTPLEMARKIVDKELFND